MMGEILGFFLAGLLLSASSGAEVFPHVLPAQYFEINPPAFSFPNFTPLIDAPSALMVDAVSGEEIWARNADERRSMASLTKLMTALIIVENHDLSLPVSVPRAAVEVEGARMRLVAGENISIRNLLNGLLIPSANDAALTLASFHSGSEAEFVKAMNQRALLLGMDSTHFANSHGLDSADHFSTARDLAILARKALEFPEIRAIVNTRNMTVSSVDGGYSHGLVSTNELLSSSFPVSGLKTGTTPDAGECLITVFTSGQRKILMIVLGSSDRFHDIKALFLPFL